MFQGVKGLLSPSVPKNVITLHPKTSSVISNAFQDSRSVCSLSKSNSNEEYKGKKDIYVCTFCQVFSPQLATVSEHISATHFELLPVGTKPENFVSKLQPLVQEHSQKKKRGRPKKVQEERVIPAEQKKPDIVPIPDSNGLYWCKVCLRNFKKPRQLIQHICLGFENEISSEESSNELDDDDVEFKTRMNVDPIPWSRRIKYKNQGENADLVNSAVEVNSKSVSDTNEKIPENKVAPNWRKDPSYIPLFDDDNEKAAFEKHLNSIDYSYIDCLIQTEGKRCRNKNKNSGVHVQSVTYSCKTCKKVSTCLSRIRLHCLIHTDLKPFTCPKCSYKSNSKGSLYMHMRMHTGNVFNCSSCAFTCCKRSHLLDHEATHNSIYQICKLCKNSYKTSRSLLSHIRRYHDNPGGKRYAKSLTGKQGKEFKCDSCNKKFKSLHILKKHNHACHEANSPPDGTLLEENHSEHIPEKSNTIIENVEAGNSDGMQLSPIDLSEIVMDNLLQHHEQSESAMYQNVFNHSSENILPSNNLSHGFEAKTVADRLAAESSILEECHKTLDLNILNECLQDSGFSNNCQEFNLLSNIPRKHSSQYSSSEENSRLNEISKVKLEEPKSVEIKLFEKCQRAPAYVCCVCSSIFICSTTLKAHLKEHVNSASDSLIEQPEEQFEETVKMEASDELDVCKILQDAESGSYDEELEKLYISSLDMMYYLPEVSVVLENDPTLLDHLLEYITNIPINDDSSSQDFNDKNAKANAKKCFSQALVHGLVS